jgi:hypothetical protein
MTEDIVVPIAFFSTVVVLAIGIPFMRALVRRWDREGGQPKLPSEVTARLERMEQAIDAVAVEVERIAEGQRFVTRLMSERPAEQRLPAQTERNG